MITIILEETQGQFELITADISLSFLEKKLRALDP